MNDSYFPHDSNARNSDKLIPVRMKYGAEGYGIYFMILERLREEKNYMSIKDYNTLAFDLRVDTSKIKAIVEDFGLFAFTENGECFYSEGFNKRMEIKDAKSKKRSEAGKKGASKRWQKNSNAIAMPSNENSKTENANAIATEKNSKESKGKETKEKESKVNEIKDYEEDIGVYEFIQKSWGKPPTGILQGALGPWIREWGSEMILFAFQSAYENSVEMHGLKKYVDRILATWKSNNVSTLQEAVQAKEDWEAKKNKKTFSNSQPKTRKEPIPNWLDDPEGYNKRKEEELKRGYEDVPF
ncbi:Lin1244/Lin1753 domain-containing protein [Enterococcus hirae]|uniref:Lin1244/Lin1753 domain-containing protein n=1 Tax=Enterococcus hirae TaxID=1354 RepID=UPI0020740766|nr:Lin1244/Lin1753 domain-containing protein [Enterococcus hirae]